MYRGSFIVCNFQVYLLFLLINIFIFHIDIDNECRIFLFSVVLLKINLLRLTITQTNKL